MGGMATSALSLAGEPVTASLGRGLPLGSKQAEGAVLCVAVHPRKVACPAEAEPGKPHFLPALCRVWPAAPRALVFAVGLFVQ